MNNEEERLRLLLVDDHPVVREGLRVMLSVHPAFTVVGEASSGEEAVEMVNGWPPTWSSPTFACPAWAGWSSLGK
jgi:CheY-like chemotaxis protein